MTEKILCGKCGFLLYYGETIERRFYLRLYPSEESILELYGNKCPRCKNELTLEAVKIEIK